MAGQEEPGKMQDYHHHVRQQSTHAHFKELATTSAKPLAVGLSPRIINVTVTTKELSIYFSWSHDSVVRQFTNKETEAQIRDFFKNIPGVCLVP